MDHHSCFNKINGSSLIFWSSNEKMYYRDRRPQIQNMDFQRSPHFLKIHSPSEWTCSELEAENNIFCQIVNSSKNQSVSFELSLEVLKSQWNTLECMINWWHWLCLTPLTIFLFILLVMFIFHCFVLVTETLQCKNPAYCLY